jgi:hypothetical protein
MLEYGSTVRAKELGFKGTGLYIYEPCPKCQQPRWHRKSNGSHRLCSACGSTQGGLANIDHTREWKRSTELGKSLYSNLVYYKDSCFKCGVELWHRHRDIGKRMCNKCHKVLMSNPMEKHPMWKGGKHLRKDGYYEIVVSTNDPYRLMINKGDRLLEHRYVMAKHLGRILTAREIVHHINGNKSDNRIENLELLPSQITHLSTIQAEREIRLLKLQVKALTERVVYLETVIQHGNPELNSGNEPDKCVETMWSISFKEDSDIVRTSCKQEQNSNGQLQSALSSVPSPPS